MTRMRTILVVAGLLLGACPPATAGRAQEGTTLAEKLGAPRVEPLAGHRRQPLPLMQRDTQPLRRIVPAARCTYRGGRRICR